MITDNRTTNFDKTKFASPFEVEIWSLRMSASYSFPKTKAAKIIITSAENQSNRTVEKNRSHPSENRINLVSGSLLAVKYWLYKYRNSSLL